MSKKLLSKKFYDRMQKLEARYPSRTALLIPALHAAQEESGWLPPDVLDEIAAFLEIHPAQAREVASFYSMFNLRPVGKHEIRICTNVSCCLRGANELLEQLEKELEVRRGETTRDGRFSLAEEECLAACGTAPAMMLDGEYHENLTPEKLERIIGRLKQEGQE
jgi:NADH-quinone oxidoreductase subunit E